MTSLTSFAISFVALILTAEGRLMKPQTATAKASEKNAADLPAPIHCTSSFVELEEAIKSCSITSDTASEILICSDTKIEFRHSILMNDKAFVLKCAGSGCIMSGENTGGGPEKSFTKLFEGTPLSASFEGIEFANCEPNDVNHVSCSLSPVQRDNILEAVSHALFLFLDLSLVAL